MSANTLQESEQMRLVPHLLLGDGYKYGHGAASIVQLFYDRELMYSRRACDGMSTSSPRHMGLSEVGIYQGLDYIQHPTSE